LIYLASPYSKYPYGKDNAFAEVARQAADLMKRGYDVFCPIAHSHPIETVACAAGDWDEVETGKFWLKQDFAVLRHCTELVVYAMPGWDVSEGVAAEIAFAKGIGIPVSYLEYNNNEVRSGHTEKPDIQTA
jgi:hypothetical protein